jgi:hypothetical protein
MDFSQKSDATNILYKTIPLNASWRRDWRRRKIEVLRPAQRVLWRPKEGHLGHSRVGAESNL